MPYILSRETRPATEATWSSQAQIAIVGAGPRGTSVLERLCASVPEFLAPGSQLTVHVVDPSPAGAGRVWRTEQSSQLIMNTVTSQVTLYTDETVVCSGPIRPGPTLYEWADDPNMGPDDYASREHYGHYLEWVFHDIVAKAPANVKVEVHSALGVRLDDAPNGRQTLTLSNGRTISGLTVVILAQGHLPLRATPEQQRLSSYAKQNGLHYLPPSNPADLDCSVIAPGEPVLLRGLGLNFFDWMALLTTGRGGFFCRDESGKVHYHPSGNEPRLYAGSRRGIPYHSRGDNAKGASGRHHPYLLTEKVARDFRKRADAGDAPDFMKEIWPLAAKEVETVYYEALLAQQGTELGDFQARFLAIPRGDAEESKILDEFNVPKAKRFSWERLQKPQGDRTFATQEEWREWMLDYLRQDAEEGKLGNVKGPLKAALDVLRDMRNELRLVVDHRGLPAASRRDDLDGWYTPLNAFLSIGPPRKRIEQMVALMEAGVLDVLGPKLKVEEKDAAWVVRSEVPGEVRVTTLIEARLEEPSLKKSGDALLQYLLQTGQCREHINDGYETGGMDVTDTPYHTIDSQGRAHERRFAVGVPTEGVHWVTFAGARPGVNSVTLQDTDAVARAALQVAATEPLLVKEALMEPRSLSIVDSVVDISPVEVEARPMVAPLAGLIA